MRRFTFVQVAAAMLAHGSALALPSLVWIDRSEQAVRGRCVFNDDERTLVIVDGTREIARHTFCTSYGKASARIVNDMTHTSYLLLEYGEGRGPNAVTDYLAIYRLSNDLVEVARTPLSWAAGPTSRWRYEYSAEAPNTGGIEIRLTLVEPPVMTDSVSRPEQLRVVAVRAKSDG